MKIRLLSALVLAGSVACSALVGGCSSSKGAAAGTVDVVASTDVWGDIAQQIGGAAVSVTSIISDPSQDPHSYEADAKVRLQISKADLLIENGGGYDDFVDTMLKSASHKATVVNAVTVSGYAASAGGDLNEHVWYDFPTVDKVIAQIRDDLIAADASMSAQFQRGAAALSAKIAGLEQTERDLKTKYAGQGAAITEPVPLYLLNAIGLVNRTPADFSKAIEDGSDVSPVVLNQTLKLFSEHTVKLLAYNSQTSGPETEKVLAAAKANNVTMVPVTETLPAGKDYLSWMTANLDAISAALGS